MVDTPYLGGKKVLHAAHHAASRCSFNRSCCQRRTLARGMGGDFPMYTRAPINHEQFTHHFDGQELQIVLLDRGAAAGWARGTRHGAQASNKNGLAAGDAGRGV